MGASFISYQILEALTPAQLRDDFAEKQRQAQYESGHQYSGTIGEASGLTISDKAFTDFESAYHWVEEHAEKWGSALAVRVNPSKDTRKPTDTALSTAKEKAEKASAVAFATGQVTLKRIQTAKAKLVGCSECKSKLAKEHLLTPLCPMCRNDLSNATERTKIASAKERYEKTSAEYNRLRALKNAPGNPGWLVGAMCAS